MNSRRQFIVNDISAMFLCVTLLTRKKKRQKERRDWVKEWDGKNKRERGQAGDLGDKKGMGMVWELVKEEGRVSLYKATGL